MNRTQLMAMLWLRWRLTLHQWRRGGGISAAITMIVAVFGLGLAVAGGIAGVAGGVLGLSKALPLTAMLVWDGLIGLFLVFWSFGIVKELQRSEIIDSSRLLHLPVSLRDVFLLNYIASHLTYSLALMLPAMLGLAIGLVLGRGAAMALLFPLVFGFFFMITAWTYCLRSWLGALMVNKRRRRAIVMGITMAFILLAQLPNLVTNVWFGGRHARSSQTASAIQKQAGRLLSGEAVLELSHRYVPLLWLPQGARALAEGRAWPAVWGAFGMIAIGTWGLARAYRSTRRFYQGGETGKPAPAPPALRTVSAGGRILVERTLPAIPEEATALAMASLRSMSRAPEIKMALATNALIFVILGASFLFRRSGALPSATQPFMLSGAVAVTFMGMAQVMCNHFGFERGGFRALVLLPASRRHILMGKNLALLPVAATVFAIYLGLASAFAHPRVSAVLAAVFEFGFAFLALSVLGNLASIFVPYRIAPGSLKPTRTRSSTQVMMFVTHLLFMLAMLPVFVPAGLGLLSARLDGLSAGAVTLLCAILLAVLSALLYWLMLEPLGRLLQRREREILEVVTQEVE